LDCGARERIPRLLDLWDKQQVKITSHRVGMAGLRAGAQGWVRPSNAAVGSVHDGRATAGM